MKEVMLLHVKRALLVVLLVLFFAAATFSGLAVADHESRRTAFGETCPLIELQTGPDTWGVNIHLFGEIRRVDLTWALRAWEALQAFFSSYGDYFKPIQACL